jgi:AcrR family transcriptional regulator
MDEQLLLAHRPRRRGARASWARIVREQILDAAEELVRTGDLRALTCETLAESLGVRPTTLFKQFHDMDDIRDSLSLRAITQLNELLEASIRECAGRQALEALIGLQRLYAQDRPGMYAAAMRGQSSAAPELVAAFAAHREIEAAALCAYGLPSDAGVELAWCLRAAIRGAIELERADRQSRPYEVDACFERLVETFDAAARAATDMRPRTLRLVAQSI